MRAPVQENGHRAALGITRSGKTTWCQVLAEELHARGKYVGVFDPMPGGVRKWKCHVFSADPVRLLDWAQTHTDRDVGAPIYLFWDEWGRYVGRTGKTAQRFTWLGTTSRHNGITNVVLAHRWQDIEPGLRESINLVWAFKHRRLGAEALDQEFGDGDGVLADELKKMPLLRFKELSDFADNRCGQITWHRGRPRVTLTRS